MIKLRKRTYKKSIIIVLILFITIGFAYLSTTLNINGAVTFRENNWDIHFENLTIVSEDVEYTSLEIDSNNTTTINASINFKEPSEIFEYTVDVVNAGGVDALFDSITNNLTSTNQEYISVDVKYNDGSTINQNDLLRMGQSKRIRVKIIYNYDIDDLPTISQTSVTTTINYVNVNLRNISYDRKVWNYEFTGYEQTFITPKTGTYKVELWGANGGSYVNYPSGKGAYVSGNIELSKGNKFYVVVGNKSAFTTGSCYETNKNATYNGSLSGGCSIGGGATDIRIVKGNVWYDSQSLASRIIVAAGGGGGLNYYNEETGEPGSGGAGGGIRGIDGIGKNPNLTNASPGKGATQTKYKFGYFPNNSTSTGGGGYYTGQGGYGGNAGGGSSFISGYKGCIAITAEDDLTPICVEETDPEDQDISCSYHYSGYRFTNGVMIPGNESMIDPDGTTVTGHSGNGYARITLID
ncbi:MAG: glycine rich domain-containing protein [Bacilli bacterium]|nr:glycine rich domain-containing protein [Bacilli bacterium]